QHLESNSATQSRISDLEKQLHERQDVVARITANLQEETVGRQLAEQQLQTSGDLSAHLRNCLASFEAAKQAFKSTQEQLESRLQASLNASGDTEARLQKETNDRQRMEEALAAAKGQLPKQSLELSKLKP